MDEPGQAVLAVSVTPDLLLRRTLHGFALQLLLKARGFLVVPIYARLLEPAGLGVITLAGAVCSLLGPLLTLGLSLGLSLRLVRVRDREALARGYRTIVVVSSLLAAVGASLLAFGVWRTEATPLRALKPYAAPFALLLAATALRDLALVVPQLRQQVGRFNALTLVMDYGGAGLGVLLVWRGFGPAGVLWAGGIMTGMGILAAVTLTLREMEGGGRPDWGFLASALAIGLPALPIGLSQWVLQAVDNLFLAHYHGQAAVGTYGVAYSLASIVLLVLGALNFVLFPTAASLWAQGPDPLRRFIERLLRLTLAALGLFVAGACLLSPWGVRVLAGSRYQDAAAVLPILVASWAAFTLIQILQKVALVVEQRTAPVARCYLLAAAVNLALNFLLIPRWAIRGAALATLISYLAGMVMMGRIARRSLPSLRPWQAVARPGALILAFTVGALALRIAPLASPLQALASALGLVGLYFLAARAAAVFSGDDWRVLKAAARPQA